MATLKDVARIAEVSPSTASRILHGGAIRVSSETRARVERVARDMAYRANSSARSLRTRVTRTLGILLSDSQNPVYAQMIVGANEAAAEHGYSLLMMSARDDARRAAFLEMVAEDRADGLILADAGLDCSWVEKLRFTGAPFVLVNHPGPEGSASVMMDDARGAAMAIAHLIEQGHREIAYLSAPLSTDVGRRRLAATREVLGRHGIALTDRRWFECGFAGEGAAAAVDRLLWHKEPITAIATGGIVAAMVAIKALLQRGVSVPEQVSVVSFHDNPFAQYMTPGITAVRMPLEEVGRLAVVHVLDLIEGAEPRAVIVTDPPPVLVSRQSVARREVEV